MYNNLKRISNCTVHRNQDHVKK